MNAQKAENRPAQSIEDSIEIQNRHYRGWIPTASGYLSLSVFGETDHPTRAAYLNVTDKKDRFIVAFQRRFMLDGLAPLINAQEIIERDGGSTGVHRDESMYFVVLAHCPKRKEHAPRKLYGTILVYQEADWNFARHKIKQMRESMAQAAAAPSTNDAKLRQPARECLGDRARRPPALSAAARARFVLRRNGLIALKLIDVGGDNDIKMTDPADADEMASQMFYFMRDMLHRHQHHHPNSDTLTMLLPVDVNEEKPLSLADEARWLRRVYQHVSRRIIDLKRGGNEMMQEGALGVMAYAKSFRDVAGAYLKERAGETKIGPTGKTGAKEADELFPGHSVHNFETLKLSVEAKLKSSATGLRIYDSKIRSRFSLSAIVLSVTAINTTVYLKRASADTVPNGSDMFIDIFQNYILKNPIEMNIVLFLFIFIMTYVRKPALQAANKADIRTARAISAVGKKRAALILIPVIMLCLYAIYFALTLPPIRLG